MNEIRYLEHLPLTTLWLQDNPCTKEEDYRLKVISRLRHLEKLDNQEVTPQEKELAMKLYGPKQQEYRHQMEYQQHEYHRPEPYQQHKQEYIPQIYKQDYQDKYENRQKDESPKELPPKRSRWSNSPVDINPLHQVSKQLGENETYVYDEQTDQQVYEIRIINLID